jgi:hypothetical protein
LYSKEYDTSYIKNKQIKTEKLSDVSEKRGRRGRGDRERKGINFVASGMKDLASGSRLEW